MEALEARNLRSRIGDFELGPIDLEVGKGEIVGLIGPSGCGKTLLLKTIAGLQEPLEGKIFIDGTDVTYLEPHHRGLAFVFQDNALFPHYDTHDNIAFPLLLKNDEETEAKVQKRAKELDGLSDYLDRWPRELPAGMKKLTAIARGTVRKFNIILMDEPFERLDKKIRLELRTLIKRLLMAMGESVLVVLNDPEDAIAIADMVYVMDRGKFVQQGVPSNVYSNPSSSFVLDLFSTMGLNRLEDFLFRPQDVELDENGIEVNLEHCGPYDSKHVLCNGRIDDSEVVLFLPISCKDSEKVRIKILKSYH